VHVDGKPKRSCVTPCGDVTGTSIVTIEGLGSRDALHPVQQAWIEENVPQCGYCQAGQNISRRSVAAGVPCTTCHQQRNSEIVGVAGGPPGAPGWGLPPAEQPMVFQDKSPTALCEQLRDPKQTHGKDLAALLDHVTHDPLVLWGWEPGGGRTLPPLDHAAFVAAFTAWVASAGACP
jgi:hypothetical protein